jgi:hypothetical protein
MAAEAVPQCPPCALDHHSVQADRSLVHFPPVPDNVLPAAGQPTHLPAACFNTPSWLKQLDSLPDTTGLLQLVPPPATVDWTQRASAIRIRITHRMDFLNAEPQLDFPLNLDEIRAVASAGCRGPVCTRRQVTPIGITPLPHQLVLVSANVTILSLSDRVSCDHAWSLSLSSNEQLTPVLAPDGWRTQTRFSRQERRVEWVTATPTYLVLEQASKKLVAPREFVLPPILNTGPLTVPLYQVNPDALTFKSLEHLRLLLQTWPNLVPNDASNSGRVLIEQPPLQPRPPQTRGSAAQPSVNQMPTNLPCPDWLSYAFHRRMRTFFPGFKLDSVVSQNMRNYSPIASSERFADCMFVLAKEVYQIGQGGPPPQPMLLGTGTDSTLSLRIAPLDIEQWRADLAAKQQVLTPVVKKTTALALDMLLEMKVMVI